MTTFKIELEEGGGFVQKEEDTNYVLLEGSTGTELLSNAKVVVNAIDLSAYVKAIILGMPNELLETTEYGEDTKTRVPGMKDWSVDLRLNDNWDDGTVDSTIWDIWDGAVPVEIIIYPNASYSLTYTGDCILEDYNPVGGSVGDVAEKSIKFQAAGAMARAN